MLNLIVFCKFHYDKNNYYYLYLIEGIPFQVNQTIAVLGEHGKMPSRMPYGLVVGTVGYVQRGTDTWEELHFHKMTNKRKNCGRACKITRLPCSTRSRWRRRKILLKWKKQAAHRVTLVPCSKAASGKESITCTACAAIGSDPIASASLTQETTGPSTILVCLSLLLFDVTFKRAQTIS